MRRPSLEYFTRRGRRIGSNLRVLRGTLSGCRRSLLRGRGRRRRRLRRVYAYELAVTPLVLELHDAVDEREQRVVLAPADVLARLPLRPALAREDVAAEHALAAELLKPEPLRVRVAPVSR